MLATQGMRAPIDIILVCIRWYTAYPLSCRHLEEMMEERGVQVDHSDQPLGGPVSALSRCRLMNVFLAQTNRRSSSGTDLYCPCIKLVGKRQLAAAFEQQLTFVDHVHEFDAGQDTSSRPK